MKNRMTAALTVSLLLLLTAIAAQERFFVKTFCAAVGLVIAALIPGDVLEAIAQK